MTGSNSSWFELASLEQARVLAAPEQRRLLEALMVQESTASSLAEQLNWPLDSTVYRLRKLLEAGLIRVAREEKRKGRPIKHYTAVAGSYRVPLSVLPFVDQVEVFRHLDQPMRDLALQGLASTTVETQLSQWFLRLYTAEGQVRMDLSPTDQGWDFRQLLQPEHPAVLLNWLPLQLTPQQAKQLQQELMELLVKYQGQGSREQFTHLLGLMLTPAPPPST